MEHKIQKKSLVNSLESNKHFHTKYFFSSFFSFLVVSEWISNPVFITEKFKCTGNKL